MGLSKETRIITLLVIDVVFFFIEIITGYAVGSLALVADSFHMLNDVMSLIVALWAVKLSTKSSDHRFSYGWQRAEILGALVNGVFLLALCFSIFMEAIQRFVNVSEVSNPKLVIIVGCLGLASNLVGLLLFHDHGHAHGGHGHSHGHGGHSHGSHSHSHSHAVTDGSAHDHDSAHQDEAESGDTVDLNSVGRKKTNSASAANDDAIRGRSRQDSVGSILGHPAQTRAFVVQTAHDLGYEGSRHQHSNSITSLGGANERSRLLGNGSNDYGSTDLESGSGSSGARKNGHSHNHENAVHNHSHASDSHDAPGHGHSHSGGHSHGEGSMNMQGVFLHVLGDALGNVGVIAAGVFILTSSAWWRFYSDPAISFLITIIIFHSALPLVKSASYILLQGVPASVSLESVRQSIMSVDGVLNLHELHVWQLSESKIVASVHVLVDCSSGQTEKYMEIAAKIRANLHGWGIHSSTIQPEFVPGGLREAAILSGVQVAESDEEGRLRTVEGRLVEREVQKVDTACLIACGDDNDCQTESCCPPTASGAPSKPGSGSATPAGDRA
ncbi:Cation efflux protein [Kalmanozyma brasiliensis GHG001]|uniref:Zinc/cadmium resistance protein n=1 Tax=Kalmanozyma brasiliensis (strain GHG001) TaxID=1365824 RepID=V5EQJ0_KALBG|nr:Cation efflux protein [Kalmanozyma brasiliensis GHG001]EST05198.1 Cation efflux protein [Kalmanozyma brasiliensis GHG001]